MKFVSLFAGIGGFDLGLERAGMQSVGQVEINEFCQRVLAYHWPHVKRIGDIRNVTGSEFGAVDLVCGGVPCQPASTAGKRLGVQDDRWLWPEAFRVVRAMQPRWCLFENVRGILTLERGVVFESLLSELESLGYEVEAFVIPACAVDAPHRRERVWILAHAVRVRLGQHMQCDGQAEQDPANRDSCGRNADRLCADVADTERIDGHDAGYGASQVLGIGPAAPEIPKCEIGVHSGRSLLQGRRAEGPTLWFPEPGVGRVANGVPGRVDRLRSLGNAVVPQVVEEIGRAILKAEEAHPCAKKLGQKNDTKDGLQTAYNTARAVR